LISSLSAAERIESVVSKKPVKFSLSDWTIEENSDYREQLFDNPHLVEIEISSARLFPKKFFKPSYYVEQLTLVQLKDSDWKNKWIEDEVKSVAFIFSQCSIRFKKILLIEVDLNQETSLVMMYRTPKSKPLMPLIV
jgi:hypothetical protein